MELFRRPGSNKWQAYCFYFDGIQRKRVLKSTGIVDDGTAKSRQTAEAVAREIERSLAVGGPDRTRPSKTLRQAIKKLIEKAELANRTKATFDTIIYRSKRLDAGLNLDTPINQIDADKIREYAVWSLRTPCLGEKDVTVSAYTVARELDVLRQAFRAVGVPVPEFPDLGTWKHKAQRVLELDEQRKLVIAMPANRKLHVMAYLQLGVRASELWKIDEWDWKDRFAHVNGTKTANSVRWVPIPDELYEALYPLRNSWQGFEKCHQTNFHVSLNRAAVRAGLRTENDEHISVNDLRGSFATHLARAGVPILTLAKIMGNSVKMLESVYAQVAARGSHLHDAVAKLPRITGAKKRGNTSSGF